MPRSPDRILTVAQMRAAEDALIERGVSVDELMLRAGCGAADWIWRMAAGHPVTVLCGPGNNGGDGYVIAEAIRRRGGQATVVAAAEPRTDAARNARSAFGGAVIGLPGDTAGEVLVDCLFGSGLSRPLSDDLARSLALLAQRHKHLVAIDVPSGVDADSGALLGELPRYDATLALGAWKFAHYLMPASALMGSLKLVEIGVTDDVTAARMIAPPRFSAPAADSHKYRRGLLAVVGGAMPGAALLAARAAQGAGAGYVKLLAEKPGALPHDLVADSRNLAEALRDDRIAALLIGPGLGRDAEARKRLALALATGKPAILDADALVLLGERSLQEHTAPLIATPHDGEMKALEAAFGCGGAGTKPDRARALAGATGMVVVAKGPDTVVAAPDGRMAFAPRASSWLSTAGTGDVLAGAIASRLATGRDVFDAACEGVWLHAEAGRLAGPAFTAGQLADAIPAAFAACL